GLLSRKAERIARFRRRSSKFFSSWGAVPYYRYYRSVEYEISSDSNENLREGQEKMRKEGGYSA
ncbi:MAG: hypothetical protein JSW39_09160, partial [Desulfobacterales bacterium]